jgi:hypothetical protein
MALATCNTLFAAESTTAKTGTYADAPTLDDALVVIDNFISDIKNDRLPSDPEELNAIGVDIINIIMQLIPADRVVALGYYYTSLYTIDEECGFTLERGNELLTIGLEWAERVLTAEIDNVEAEWNAFEEMCQTLREPESLFLQLVLQSAVDATYAYDEAEVVEAEVVETEVVEAEEVVAEVVEAEEVGAETATLESVIAEIDEIVKLLELGAELSQSDAERILSLVFLLEGTDRIDATAYLYASINKIYNNFGFTLERSKELREIAYELAEKFYNSSPLYEDHDEEFTNICSNMNDSEVTFIKLAFSTYLNMMMDEQ